MLHLEMTSDNAPVLCFTMAAFGLAVWAKFYRNKIPLPPGPPGLPLLGNLFSMRSDHRDWLAYYAWGRQYGDISSITILGQTLVILNSPEAAEAMLTKKSAIYSDRPVLQMCGELCGWNNTLVLLRYGDRWRRTRRFFRNVIGSTMAIKKFHPAKEAETQKFLARLLKTPENFRDHTRSLAGSSIVHDTYGHAVVNYEKDPLICLAEDATEQFSRSAAGYIVDFLPFLKHVPDWMPGAHFKTEAREWRTTLTKLVDQPYDFTKNEVTKGNAPVSFVSILLEEADMTPEKEFELKWSAASLYSGAADTSVSAMAGFFLAMALAPQAVKAAQEEIDRVVGMERLPSFGDRPKLPYIEALVWEVLRFTSVVPTSVPHRLIQDDIHEGYFIPKGSLIIANLWGMTHDERRYNNPMKFLPERFLGDSPEKDPRSICFGFGRRICPGNHLADATLWIMCAQCLAVFDIQKARDESGRMIEPTVDQTIGTISHPVPFLCSIKPRSEKAIALIQEV